MRRPQMVEEVRGLLLRDGFGRDYATRTAWELHDHWMDLVEEGLRQGQARAEAEEEARKRLGSTTALTKELSDRMRQSSWLGRNPSTGFALLALGATLVWWTVLLLAVATVSGLTAWDPKSAGSNPPSMFLVGMGVDAIGWSSLLALPWLLCHVSQKYFCGWKGAFWGCLVVAIHSAMHVMRIENEAGTRTIFWGYSFSTSGPSLPTILIPLLSFALFMIWSRRPEADRPNSSPTCS